MILYMYMHRLVMCLIITNQNFLALLESYTKLWNNECDGVSNHRCLDCLLSRLYRRGSKKTSKLRVTGICEGNSPVTGEFPSQRASNTENVSI